MRNLACAVRLLSSSPPDLLCAAFSHLAIRSAIARKLLHRDLYERGRWLASLYACSMLACYLIDKRRALFGKTFSSVPHPPAAA